MISTKIRVFYEKKLVQKYRKLKRFESEKIVYQKVRPEYIWNSGIHGPKPVDLRPSRSVLVPGGPGPKRPVDPCWNIEVISRLCTRRLNNYLKTQLIKAQAERIQSLSKKKFSRFRMKGIRCKEKV